MLSACERVWSAYSLREQQQKGQYIDNGENIVASVRALVIQPGSPLGERVVEGHLAR